MEPMANRNDGNLYASNTIEPSLVYLLVGMGIMFFLVLTLIGVNSRGESTGDKVFSKTNPSAQVEEVPSEPSPEIGGLLPTN
ncbi:hypothetical protein Spb1_37690 [Planctopirus ephydatiae]|jgi:hypothetical protein|uniref:Uncharacterized protein n=1 Tax=Planctopirus ephydatiae TaxID=2528019 RepID=A0A518GTA8_9PLAN|nr:hypothetical protein [Planctopirus ephydatiae]QDV31824.1 hypothetical protein Spb1_37690 [Planctopirus ephydatiae]